MVEMIGVLDNISFEEHINVDPKNLNGNSYDLVPIQHPMGHEIELEQGPFVEAAVDSDSKHTQTLDSTTSVNH